VTEQPSRARDRGDLAAGVHGASARARPAPRRIPIETDREDSRANIRNVPRVVAWALGYAAAAWLGHRSVVGGSGFELFWPASGVALIWIATARWTAVELVLSGLLAAGTLALLDAPTWEAVNALLGVPGGLAVFVVLSRRWVPGVWGAGGERQVATLREYGLLVAAAAVGGLTEATVAAVTLLPEPGSPVAATGELAVPHTVALVVVGVTGLVVGGWFAALPREGRWPARVLAGVRRDSTRTDVATGAIVALATVAIFLTGFARLNGAPVNFVLVMVVVGVGIRFYPPATGVCALLITSAAWWFTAAGRGPIADIPEPHRRVLALGVFSVALVVTGLTIALGRRERDAIIDRLRDSERAAEVLADDLTLVLANLEEGVAVVEEGGRFLHANAAIGRLLEMPDFNDAQVEPVDSYRLVHPDGRPLLESEVPHVRAFAGEENVHDVLHLARPGGSGERIFEVSARLLPQIRGTDLPRAVTTIRDVTAEHEQRDALSSFAQVVAHDLRSPLTSVDLWARELLDLYEEGPVDAATGTMVLRHIGSGTSRMQNFISDLLSYALSRDQTPSPVRLELTDVVESVVETIAAIEGARPEVHYDNLPLVWCDPVLVPQLFDNLIGNARKYVAEGVVPKVHIEATSLPDDWVRVRVSDNGVGIAPADRDRVFGTFERARATEFEGTGLGLAICRHIVERHGGAIGAVTPPEGCGACIELTLPTTDEAFDRATTR
jgi:signal transduction histidine kinase